MDVAHYFFLFYGGEKGANAWYQESRAETASCQTRSLCDCRLGRALGLAESARASREQARGSASYEPSWLRWSPTQQVTRDSQIQAQRTSMSWLSGPGLPQQKPLSHLWETIGDQLGI